MDSKYDICCEFLPLSQGSPEFSTCPKRDGKGKVCEQKGGRRQTLHPFPSVHSKDKSRWPTAATKRALPIVGSDQKALFPQLSSPLTSDGGLWSALKFGTPYGSCCCLLPLRPRTASWSQGISSNHHSLSFSNMVKMRKLSLGFSEPKHMTLISKEKQTSKLIRMRWHQFALSHGTARMLTLADAIRDCKDAHTGGCHWGLQWSTYQMKESCSCEPGTENYWQEFGKLHWITKRTRTKNC